MKKTKRSFVADVVLGLGSVALSLLLAEFLLRVFLPAGPESTFCNARYSVHEISSNPKLLYKLRSNAVNEAHGVLNKINCDGFRDRDYPVDKQPGVRRLLFLGDSIIYGYGLELNDTLPKQLENTFLESGVGAEVLNFGVSGYETEQEVEFFKTGGLKYRPDVVIVGYSINDCRYASLELDKFSELPGNHVYQEGDNLFKKALTCLYDHSRLMQFLDARLRIRKKIKELRSYREPMRRYIEDRNRRVRDPKDSPYRRLEESVAADARKYGTSEGALGAMLEASGLRVSYDIGDSHWNVSKKAFLDLKDLALKYRFKVVIVIFPYFLELDKYALGSVHRFLEEEFEAMGFKVIDLTDYARRATAEYGNKISGDRIHLTPLGSALIAKYLYGEILREGLLN